MDFRILGPLEVTDRDREPVIASGKQRALLAILLLHANEVVSSDRLIEELWGEQPPASAAKSLQVHVSRLRRALEGGRGNGTDAVVITRGGGYLVRVEPGELDLERFERLLEEGSGALADGAPERALPLLREALGLWRGPPLAEFAYESFAQRAIARLEELRLTALEHRIEAELVLGRHAQLIAELESLVEQHPFRERLHGLLMLALYRSGRQTEALQAYRHARRTLVDEVGIEPGQPLRELERAILAQDPALDSPAAANLAAPPAERAATPADGDVPRHRRRPGRAIVAAALALAALAVAAGILLLSRGSERAGSPPLTDDSHAVAIIDPTANRVSTAVSVGTNPGPLAFEPRSRSVWVGNLDDRTVTRIDVRPLKRGRTIALPERPEDLAAGGGAVWVAGAPRTKPYVTAHRIDTRFDTRSAPLHVESLPGGAASLALAGRALWIAPSTGRLTRVSAATGEPAGSPLDAGPTPSTIAARAGAVWAGDTAGAGVVSRIDAGTGAIAPTPVTGSPTGIALGAGTVWVTLALDDAVARIDPESGAVRGTTPVGQGPAGVAVGAGGVWVANSDDGTVSRLDPRNGRVTDTIPIGASPQDVVVADGRVWVSVRPRAPAGAAPGGTIRIETPENDELGPLDPALAYVHPLSVAIVRATCAKLLDFPGARPAPDLAEALPRRSDGGRTYTFTIRRGFRFSPPLGEPVTARSMKYTIERSLDPRMKSPSPATGLVRDLVGGSAYAEGRARHISGVRASGNKLRLSLVKPSSTFLERIALSAFCAVPEDTPRDPEGLRTVPAAGPYYIASHVPDEEIVLRRNPNYGGLRRGAADELRITLGVSQTKTAARIEAGTVDYTPISENPQLARRLQERYGHADAEAGGPRYVVKPMGGVDYVAFNTSRAPFSSARLRRAVNYALDRRALAREGLLTGLPAQPTDQYLPPTLPGYRDARIYPQRPDVARARRLAGAQRRSVVLYTAGFPSHLRFAEIVKANLRAIGIEVEVKNLGDSHFARIQRRHEPFDMALVGWLSDYPDPADILSQLDGRTIREDGNLNTAYFDDPAYSRRLDAATGLPSPARELALGKLDVDVARTAAPWAAVANDRLHDFFSARIGCRRYNPLYGVDLASLCIRRG